MFKRLLTGLALLSLALAPARAALTEAMLPADAVWYVHVDVEQMRNTPVGQRIYQFLDKEIFTEVRSDTGVDLDRELHTLTAFSRGEDDATVVLEGPLSQPTRDKLLAALEGAGNLSTGTTGGLDYYQVDELEMKDDNVNISGDSFFVSFDRPGGIVLSSSLDGLTRGLSGPTAPAGGRALLVLRADRSLMQAGIDADALGEDMFDSGLLREARQVAVVLADNNGLADLTVQITSDDPRTTNALASIVRGLIGLQSLSTDIEPEISNLLSSVRVDTDSAGLTLSVQVDPDLLAEVIE